MFRFVPWTLEVKPDDVNTTVFKFPVGVEFNIAVLHVTVTVNSIENMIIQKADAGIDFLFALYIVFKELSALCAYVQEFSALFCAYVISV